MQKFSDNYIKHFIKSAQQIKKPTVQEQEDLWGYVPQEIDSADTSQHQNPSAIQYLLKKYPEYLKPDGINTDIGGGKYDKGSDLLKDVGVTNYIYDPFNRPKEHNEMVSNTVRGGKSPTVTVSNVLNVIKEPEIRARVIKQAADAVDPVNGVVIFSIYEADRSGVGKMTKDNPKTNKKSWQNNLVAAAYLPEIEEFFNDVQRKGTIIIARQPKVTWR